MNRNIVVCVVLVVLGFSSYIAFKQVNRGMLRAELNHISHVRIGDEGDYVDVARWIALRKKLKSTLSENNSKIKHIRLAEVELEMPLLGPSFHQKIANPPKWMVDQVEKELANFSGFSPHDIQNLIDRIQKEPDWVNNHLYVIKGNKHDRYNTC